MNIETVRASMKNRTTAELNAFLASADKLIEENLQGRGYAGISEMVISACEESQSRISVYFAGGCD